MMIFKRWREKNKMWSRVGGVAFSKFNRYYLWTVTHHQIDRFDGIAETRDKGLLSNATAVKQLVKQPESRGAYAGRRRSEVQGSIYYGGSY